jgi:hypothetical protein
MLVVNFILMLCFMVTYNFTIEFTKWLNDMTTPLKNNLYIYFKDGKIYTINELIQIFINEYYEK